VRRLAVNQGSVDVPSDRFDLQGHAWTAFDRSLYTWRYFSYPTL
jgi:hypothetical protein